jgi:GT2 family glycosyltransferase
VIAVVVVNYRTPELTSRCLSSVRADEVVVVDNASGDGSVDYLRERHPEATIVARDGNDGFAAGVNAGFAATRADTVVLLNPDTEPRPDALARLAGHLDANPGCGVAAPRLLYGDGTPQPSAYKRPPNLAILTMELCLPVGWLAEKLRLDPYRVAPSAWRTGARVAHAIGAALAIRRSAYEAAGPLDEGFFLYLEETEWQERVRRAGYTIELVPEAEVVHLVRGGGDESLAPSPHFLTSMRRYLALRGHRPRTVGAAIDGALLLARLAARADRRVPRAAAYDELWRRRHCTSG